MQSNGKDARCNPLRKPWAGLLRHYGFDLPERLEHPTPPVALPAKNRGFAKTRTEAFSDGVFSVALTLLVVDLSTTGLPHDFSDEKWHEFGLKLLAWLYSTATVGMYWIAHHNEMQHIESVNRLMLWINLLFLCLIVLFPFSGVMLGVYWHAAEQLAPEKALAPVEWALGPEATSGPLQLATRAPVLVYGGNLVVAGLVLGWLWRYAARPDAYGRPRFLEYNKASDDEVLRAHRRNKLIPELGSLVIVVGVVCPEAGQYAIILVPVAYISLSIWYAVQMEHLRESHRITALGILGRTVPVPPSAVRRHKLARETGVRVQSMASNGAARAVGMQSGDIIVFIDGRAVGDVDELQWRMTQERDSQRAEVTVLRGQPHTGTPSPPSEKAVNRVVVPRESPPR
jgi:hypothetical protein